MTRFSQGSAALLLATAALGPAWAQPSQVQISGFLDLGIYRDFQGTAQLGTIQRSSISFSGAEDLGGGLQATFRLSHRLELDTGLGEGYGQKPFWHGESTVGLKGGWGQVRLGRALSALWAHDWKFDPWGHMNRVSSSAWYQWFYYVPTDRASNNGAPEFGRTPNGIFYDAPNLAGFTLHLSGSPERTQGPGGGKPYAASLEYAQGAAAAMLAFDRNGSGDRASFAAVKYRFGATTLMSSYDDSRRAQDQGRSRVLALGATHKLDGSVTLKAGLGHQRLNSNTHMFYSLGADYAVSRRTTLYAGLGQQRPENKSPSSSFGVGMSHAF
ncbi:porin [Comamonas guangdongensis]|uniref:Porin n=1 Tax=Comamonas guangdongensis TaxID=510515 RepID=A0ABV3ZV40_9BURK